MNTELIVGWLGLGWAGTTVSWLNSLANGGLPVVPEGPPWLVAVASALFASYLLVDCRLTQNQ